MAAQAQALGFRGVQEGGLGLHPVGQELMVETLARDPVLHRLAGGGLHYAEHHHGDDAAAAGVPRIATRSSNSTKVGVMDDSGRLPGAMALALEPTSP